MGDDWEGWMYGHRHEWWVGDAMGKREKARADKVGKAIAAELRTMGLQAMFRSRKDCAVYVGGSRRLILSADGQGVNVQDIASDDAASITLPLSTRKVRRLIACVMGLSSDLVSAGRSLAQVMGTQPDPQHPAHVMLPRGTVLAYRDRGGTVAQITLANLPIPLAKKVLEVVAPFQAAKALEDAAKGK